MVNHFFSAFFSRCAVILVCLLAGCTLQQASDDAPEETEGVQVPEGYTVEVVAGPDLVDYPMFGMVDETGRLFVFESTGNVYEESEDAIEDPQFRIKLLEDEDGDGVYDKSTIFADRLSFPQGGVFYKGSLYASSAPDLLKLTDTDGDGVADEREVLLSGWALNVNANSLIGPFMGPDGWLYMTSATDGFDVTTQEGERLQGGTSRIWRVRPDGSDLEWISAGGMANPVELTFTAAGEPLGTYTYFTNPRAGQRDAIAYFTEGGVYPKPDPSIQEDGLPLTGELLPVVAKYSRVSPSGIGTYRSTGLGEEFQNNLFTAQFNTHRVLRHKLIRDGASFRTEDEVFFWWDNPDFHPTDVLEDADGSLLVVETGGWFIKGCPLSQVSKPELKGAIYRIRRTDAPQVEDPYGNQIQWTALSPGDAAAYLEDPRPFVRDRAAQHLVDQQATAAPALTDLLATSSSADARMAAVFTLYRIGTPEALDGVRQGLGDDDPLVRIAAARSAGLAGDPASVDRLLEIMDRDEPAVRRQAATALGQIGDEQAIPVLLQAAEAAEDRMVEHAIIYALIKMDKAALVQPGLEHTSSEVRRAALIALDQMESSPLRADQIKPFLESDDAALQQTALWVASHHPDWSGEMMTLLGSRIDGPPLNEREMELYKDVLVSFCGDVGVQGFMADQMVDAPAERRLFLLNSMAECGVEAFPQSWARQIGNQLAADEPDVQARALELVRMRQIAGLADELREIANAESEPAALRIQAMGAIVAAQPELSEAEFAFLYEQLQPGNDAPLRPQAASVLGDAELSEDQLLQIAHEYLPQADAFILPRLIPVFRGAHNAEIGRALAEALQNSPSLDSFTEEYVQEIFEEYPDDVVPSVDQLLSSLHEARAGRLERLESLEADISGGDIERGRELYFGKAMCSTCHTIGPEGGNLGPDLTSIQRDRSAHDLLEATLYPSVSFVRDYETYRIRTNTDQYTGIIRAQTPEAIILAIGTETTVRIPRGDIMSTELLDVSMMPPGLDQLLSETEMADLMAFIIGQDQNPNRDEMLLR